MTLDLSSGTVFLQGGREFFPDCLPMDAAVLAAAGPGPVVVLASAARPGSDYASAGANGARHYRDAGAPDVRVAPDPRDGEAATVAALARARVVVLPGGSPSSLHAALMGADGAGTAVGAAVLAVLAGGGAVMGSSAGAMVLCARTLLPDAGRRVVDALGVVPGVLALVHWSGPGAGWESLEGDAVLLGLPEASGLMVRPGGDGRMSLTAVGMSASGIRAAGVWQQVPVGETVIVAVAD